MNPFDQLINPPRIRLPKAAEVAVVVAGKKVTDVRQIDAEDRASYAKKVQVAKQAAKYQRARKDPEKMAKRQQWYEANKEKVRAYKKAWDAEHLPQIRKAKAEWRARAYHANPEEYRRRTREYYARNRAAVLARAAAKRAAEKADKEQARGLSPQAQQGTLK
jgi:hypothetical protein